MGLLNKLMFWRKDDDFDIDSLADKEIGGIPSDDLGLEDKMPGLDEPSALPESGMPSPTILPLSSRPSPSFGAAPTAPYPGSQLNSKELDLISSKLDTLRAQLSSIEQRLANIEKATASEEPKGRLW